MPTFRSSRPSEKLGTHSTIVRLNTRMLRCGDVACRCARLRKCCRFYCSIRFMSKRPLKTLERALSKAGLGSRTEARKWIGTGRVRVNGKLIQTPDYWVDLERDKITFDGKPLARAEPRYILLYKPKGYLTTYRDPEGRPTVYDLLPGVDQF